MATTNNRDALTRRASIITPFEMAVILFNASVRGAAGYALAAQQDARARRDEQRTVFWQRVGHDLETLRDRMDDQAAA